MPLGWGVIFMWNSRIWMGYRCLECDMEYSVGEGLDGEWVWRTIARRSAVNIRQEATILGLQPRTAEGKCDVVGASLLTCLDGLAVYVPVG